MNILQSAVAEYASDEARSTISHYLEDSRDEGTVAALNSFKRDLSTAFLSRLFGDDSDSKRAYLDAILSRLTSADACFPREVVQACRDAISALSEP